MDETADQPDPVSVEPAPAALRRSPRAGQRSRPRRPRRAVVWGLRLLLLAFVFLLGLVIGKAVEDSPTPGGQQTIVNTLRISTVGPAETVTVTVGGQ